MSSRTLILCVAAVFTAACGTPGQDLEVKVAPAPVMPASYPVGAEIGRLLSSDPVESEAAEARLIALDSEDKQAFLSYVQTLGAERDLRLLHVLDEHHALPVMPAEARLDFLLWKAARPERFYVMKAQSRLIDMARADPQPLIRRLEQGEPGSGVLGIVLALSETYEAFPALLRRYRNAFDGGERAAAAEAIGILAGASKKPRATGSRAEIARNASALETWYQERRDREAEVAATAGPVEEDNP